MPMLTTAAGRFCYFNRPASPGGGGNPPTVMQENIGFNFPGERSAEAYFTFYEENGTSYTWQLFESPIPPPYSFTQISSGSDVLTKITESITITYYGETVYDFYFYFRVTVSNGYGSATLDSSVIQNVFPP